MPDTGKLEDDVAFNGDTDQPAEGMTFAVENGGRVQVEDGSQPGLDSAPSKSAERAKWVDYCVSLGADRNYLENETEHIVDATPGAEVVETHEAFSVADLKNLAETLGG